MDWISSTTTSAAELITAQRRCEPMVQRIERYKIRRERNLAAPAIAKAKFCSKLKRAN
jgi:hypothetical protein